MSDYWLTGYNGAGAYPIIKTMMSGPDFQYSRGKTVTLLSGTGVTNYSDLTVLTDGLAQKAVKTVEATATFVIDLTTTHVLDYAAVINSNATSVRVRLSASPSLTSPVVDIDFTPDVTRLAWVDLRGFNPSAVRYVGFTLTSPSFVSVAELLAGGADLYDGIISTINVEMVDPRQRIRSDYGVPEFVVSEAFTRKVAVAFRIMDTSEKTALLAMFDSCGAGYNFFFVPESREPIAFWIEWPDDWQRAYTDIVNVEVSGLSLLEETFSVL